MMAIEMSDFPQTVRRRRDIEKCYELRLLRPMASTLSVLVYPPLAAASDNAPTSSLGWYGRLHPYRVPVIGLKVHSNIND